MSFKKTAEEKEQNTREQGYLACQGLRRRKCISWLEQKEKAIGNVNKRRFLLQKMLTWVLVVKRKFIPDWREA